MNSTRKLWVLWFLLVFGLFNLYGPPLSSYKTADDPADISATRLARRLDPVQFIGLLARNDGDIARYFSYANAMLGRPYSTYYVRKMEAWTAPERDQPARVYPKVTPDRPLLPWRDFSMEYPPGMAILALVPALLASDFNAYHLLFCLEMELLLTLSVFAAVRAMEKLSPGQGARTFAFAILLTAALGSIAARRYDACVSLSLSLTFLALAARRPAGAGAALAFGVACKGAPILVAPLGMIHYAAARRWRELFTSLAGAAALCIVAGLAYLALAGDHWRDVFVYHGGRPLQIESTYSALLIVFSGLNPALVEGSVNSFGSDNILSPWEPALRPIAEIAPLVATLAVCCWFWRAQRACASEFDRLVALAKAACAIVVAFSALGKVFSPQYLVWLTPVAAMAGLNASRASKTCLLVGMGLTQLEYPYVYMFLSGSLPPVFGLLALLRNGAMIVWTAQLLVAPRQAEPGESPTLATQAA